MSENVFNLPLPLKDGIAVSTIRGSSLFFIIPLKILFYCLLAPSVAIEDSVVRFLFFASR